MMDIPLDEVLHFGAITSDSSGAAVDADSTPTWAVREEATDAAIQTGNFTKRTSEDGHYRGVVTLSAANGFEVGKWYEVLGLATVDSVAGKAIIKTFRVVPAENTAGVPIVDVGYVDGEAATTALPGDELADTTIATLATQTSFTLTAGSADDDAYTGCMAVFIDQSTSTQRARCTISGYTVTGSTKTVTLAAAPEFTIATGDTVKIVAVPKQLSGHVPQTGDAYAIVNSGTHGNAALKTLIDALPTAAAIATAVWAAGTRTLTAATNITSAIAAAVWEVATSGLTTAGTIGKLLVDNINATISSRLASASYTTPPTAAENATQVRTELGTELGRIDAAISTRATPAQVQSEVTDALNAYDPPTNAEMEARTLAAASYATAASLASLVTTVGAAGAGLTDLGGMSTTMKAQVEQEALDALQQTVPDSIPADGSRPNLQQAAYMLLQSIVECSISGTTMTVKKPDGSTTLFTITLDGDTTPTSKTRAS